MYAFVLSLALLVALSYGDIGYYENTNAETVTDENLLSRVRPQVEIYIRTSNSYLAGTGDQVYATFIGDYSSAGPMPLAAGVLNQGEHSTHAGPLDRGIGELRKVLLHKDGTDGYLLSNMRVRMGDKVYEMTGPRQWLDNLDPMTEDAYPESGGYEPEVQERMDVVPISPALELTVQDWIYYYTDTGIFGEG